MKTYKIIMWLSIILSLFCIKIAYCAIINKDYWELTGSIILLAYFTTMALAFDAISKIEE